MTRAMIVGAGIGGLTAAIALREAGFEVAVFERRSDPRRIEIGGGMVLWTNATRALSRVGLTDQVAAAGAVLERFEWRTPRDSAIASWPVGRVARELGAPTVGIRRMNLQSVLAGAVEEGVLRLGAEVVGVAHDSDSATVTLADGTQERGDVLIGADGINSIVRSTCLHPREKVKYAGYALWFGISPAPPAPEPVFREFDGPGARFIHFPVAANEIYWSAIANAREGEVTEAGGADIAGDREMLLERYRDWSPSLAALLAAPDEAAIYRREIADRDPVSSWSTGRVTLLGDAAHAMTINLGQGACQAVEDGVVLAQCLRGATDIPAALRDYEARRTKRTKPVVLRSRQIGELGRWTNPVACFLRTQLQRAVFPTVAYREYRRNMSYEFEV